MLVRVMMACGLALGLTACSSMQSRIAFDPMATPKLEEVRIVSTLPQDEVIVRADTLGVSYALGGGLIGAFIDSKVTEGRQNTLQSIIEPFYAAVDDYNFRTRLTQAINSALASGTPFKFGPVEESSIVAMFAADTARQKTPSNGKGIMHLRTKYTFSQDFKVLQVITAATLSQSKDDDPVFKNTFVYVSAPVGTGSADSLKVWAENNGARYRNTADEAAQQIAAMIKLDLSASATTPKNLPSTTLPVIADMVPRSVKAPVIQSLPGRAIARHIDGHLYSIAQ